jgi:hypothetical protein
VIFIASSKKNIKRAYSSFTTNIGSIQNTVTTGGTARITRHRPELLKGTNDTIQPLQRFRHTYNDTNSPNDYVDANFNTTTVRVTDQNQMIEHVLNNIDPEISKKQPYFTTSALHEGKVRCIYEDG